MTSLIEPFVSHEAFTQSLAIAAFSGNEETRTPFRAISSESPRKAAAGVSESIDRVRRSSEMADVVVIESVGQLESTFASSASGLLEGIAARVSAISQASTDAMLLLLQSDSLMKSRVLAMCRGYARLFIKDRSVVLLGEKPATEAFVLEHSEDNSLIPKLTRIV